MNQEEYINSVNGKKIKEILLYALSTCIWCKKTKEHLKKQGVAYNYINVDQLDGKTRKKVNKDLKKWNPSCSFPTIVIDNKECIKGYDPEKIKEKLGL
jgi:glutaredoxin